jgi:hypothetical protein
MAEVSGKVTYRGAPVPGGTVQIVPTGGGAPLTMALHSDGTFRTGSVPFGEYRVAVETESAKGALQKMFPGQGPTEAELAQLPPQQRANMPVTHTPSQADLEKMPPEMRAQIPVYVEIPGTYADPNKSGLTWEIKKSEEKKNFDLQ